MNLGVYNEDTYTPLFLLTPTQREFLAKAFHQLEREKEERASVSPKNETD